MKVFCVRIGDKYGQEYEDYIERKLGKHYEVIWIRDPIQDNIKLQWNKMYPMSLDLEEPVCVIDIDMLLVNDYRKAFDYPIERGQFLAMRAWWRDTLNPDYSINGGFFKYYPKDCNYIFEKFMNNPEHWQSYYIDVGITMGPVNGEQYFVEDAVREKLEIVHLPSSWAVRWLSDDDLPDNVYLEWQHHFTKKYKDETSNDYVYLGDFYEDIKLVHFTHAENLPHTWKFYQNYLYP